MNGLLKENALGSEIHCDSAGIGGWHVGGRADSRMRKHGSRRNYDLTSIARQFDPTIDFDEFDLILGMDDQNISDLKGMARNDQDLKKIVRMTDYCTNYNHYNSVPDPYYGGEEGFELVLDLLEDACEGLLKQLNNERK